MSAKTYDRQSGELIARIAENLPEMSSDIMQGWIDNPKALQKFLAGLCPETSKFNFLIHVDRLVKPSYPDWVKKVIHPELELAGPVVYNPQDDVEQWLHDDQKNGVVVGNTIYKCLKDTNALATCLNLQDGLAIQAKGISVFRKLFTGKAVFLWGSVVQSIHDNLFVPYLYESGARVVMDWAYLNNSWRSSDPALRFRE